MLDHFEQIKAELTPAELIGWLKGHLVFLRVELAHEQRIEEMRGNRDLFIRDVCELEPANENADDFMFIRLYDLEVIADRHIGKLEKAIAIYCRENFGHIDFENDSDCIDHFMLITSEDCGDLP